MENNRVLSLNLSNSYGIKNMNENIKFTNSSNSCMIYASNGVMKTSLSKTLEKLSKGELPQDEVFNRKTDFTISYSNVVDTTSLSPSNNLKDVFVIHSLDNTNDFAQASSSLLVHEDAREKFVAIHQQINTAINTFKSSLKKLLGQDHWQQLNQFINQFINEIKNDESLILVLNDFINEKHTNNYSEHKYKDLFNDHTTKLFNNHIFIENVLEYTASYNKLLSESNVFSETGFDPQNADNLLGELKKANFFKASHKVILNNDETIIIQSDKDLKAILDIEKKRILNDDLLIEKFSGIEKLLSNTHTRKFRDIIKAHPEYIPLLTNKETFERDYWLSILKNLSEEISVISKIILENQEDLSEIRQEALDYSTEWHRVVDEYNSRFHVPFELIIRNKDDVILNLDLPVVEFKYKDKITGEEIIKNYESLQNVLSNGEKRALYFLNIIFKVESLKNKPDHKLLIFDDIADSFDYKNKYAIIQYIKELSNETNFDILVLTHNYDFYRTLHTRIPIKRENSFIARLNNDNSITLNNQEKSATGNETLYLGNVFSNWVKIFFTQKDEMIMTASITFFRNLLEYRYTKDKEYYNLLTSIMHIKENTNQITWGDIFPIFQDLLPELEEVTLQAPLVNKLVLDSIFENAEVALQHSCQSNLEHKVVLAMAIRLMAEKQALSILGLPFGRKEGNQTYELYKEVKESNYPFSQVEKELFEQVMIMTPEHLHLNSFMFEPLIDTSIDSLTSLYIQLKNVVDNP